VRPLRSNEHDVVPAVAMESRHCSQVLSQLLTVARFKGLTEFLDSVGCDLFCLLDFHDLFLLVSGSFAPFAHLREQTSRNRRTEWRERSVAVAMGGTRE